jgi:hypothetical protein
MDERLASAAPDIDPRARLKWRIGLPIADAQRTALLEAAASREAAASGKTLPRACDLTHTAPAAATALPAQSATAPTWHASCS